MKRILILLFSILILLIAGIFVFNYYSLVKPVRDRLNSDSRNIGIDLSVHYKNYIVPSLIVVDLKKVHEDKAIADVFRVLLQTAQVLKNRNFDEVVLTYKGKPKFKLVGTYFSQLGQEFETQNPVYTMRTFTENVYDLKGNNAYQKWSGGLLGVLNKQIEDFQNFNEVWYLNDMKTTVEVSNPNK